MALLWFYDCGARHSDSQMGRGISSCAGTDVLENAGRGGNTPVIRLNGSTDYNTAYAIMPFSDSNIAEVYVAFRIKTTNGVNISARFFKITDASGNVVVELKGGVAGAAGIDLYKEATLVQSGAFNVSDTCQRFVEIHVKPAGSSTGVLEMHVDGVSVYSSSALTFTRTGIASITLGPFYNNPTLWQDFIVFDPNGNTPNTWLGPKAFLATQFPTGDGNTHAWSLSAGSDHYALVDETPADDATSYVYSDTVDQIDQYTFPDLPAQVSSVVAAALVVQGAPYGEGSSFSIQPSVRVSSTDYLPVSAQDGPSSFNDTQFIIDEDPSTAAAWTISGLNGAQLGLKHVSSS